MPLPLPRAPYPAGKMSMLRLLPTLKGLSWMRWAVVFVGEQRKDYRGGGLDLGH